MKIVLNIDTVSIMPYWFATWAPIQYKDDILPVLEIPLWR